MDLALTAKRPISYGRRNYEISMINEQRPSVMMYILIYFKQDIYKYTPQSKDCGAQANSVVEGRARHFSLTWYQKFPS